MHNSFYIRNVYYIAFIDNLLIDSTDNSLFVMHIVKRLLILDSSFANLKNGIRLLKEGRFIIDE